MPNKILIVENDLTSQVLLREILEKNGYRISGVLSSGEEMAGHLKQHAVDLVVMDVVLDGAMDGIQAARAMQDYFDIPVIFLTAFSSDELVSRAVETSTFGFLSKPYKDTDMLTVVRLAISRHAAENQRRQSDARYRELFQCSSDSIFLLDEEGRINDCNKAAENMYGYSRDQMLSRSFSSFVVDDFESDVLQEELLPYDNADIQWHWKRDRVPFPVEVSYSKYNSGDDINSSVIVRDISHHILMIHEQKKIVSQIKDLVKVIDSKPDIRNIPSESSPGGKTLYDLGMTQKESEVTKYLVKGLSNKEIASRLNLSTETIKSHVSSILKKTGMKNRVELINYVIKSRINLGSDF